ncbi:hypothetical protein BDZ97DRAFT_1074440 [Flammula alnicola]|nr:hypothetical protein BDZ97DRAFT_1074440 [Flammula alnicola]
MFTFREVNQMESEMCNYLDWELTVVDPILSNFEITVKNDFREMKPTYPNYPTTFVSKRAARAEASTTNTPFDEKSNTTSPVPGFTTARNTAPAAKMTPERLLRRLGAPICFQTYCQSRGLDVQHSLR